MSAITIRLPDSVHQTVRRLAERDNISLNQFIASAVSEKMAAFLTVDHLKAEAAAARREDFDAVMELVPAVPAQATDRLAG